MTVAEFVRRADAVVASGPLALLSTDLPILRAEVRSSIAALRTEEAAGRRRGRAPFCLPAPGTQIDPFEMLAELRSLPAAQQRRLQLRDGMRVVATRRFRCR